MEILTSLLSMTTATVPSACRHACDLDHLTIRRAGLKDANTIAELFHSMYRNSSHPFHSTTSVAEFLQDTRNFQIIAEADNRIVASMAMTFNPWNEAYELGRAITVPEYRRNGLAGFLMQQVVDWAAAAGCGELIFGYPRVRRIAELCETLDPKIIPVGHDAGRNVANGSRETHLIVCGIPRTARFTHVVPPVSELLGWRFLRERIYTPLGLTGSGGPYPARCFIGTVSRNPVASGAWLLDYAPEDPSGAVEVIGREDDYATPSEMIGELDEIFSRWPEVRHVTATVLADKVGVIRALAGRGFEISAYLPAWYSAERLRYDCVQLARRQYTDPPATQDFPDLLGGLQSGFEASPLLRRSEERCKFQACA
jgi:GNAT superfamily N-acetyltransferase